MAPLSTSTAGKEEGGRRHLGSRRRPPAALVVVVVVCLLTWAAGPARGDFASDQAECAESLVGLSTCLTYVEGSAVSPTPDCCSGLRQVIGRGPKCLCILIKDRNEPQLGFKIDANRAMSLPSTCKTPVNISQCIDLLKLDPSSKDAEIFKQYGNGTKAGTSSEKAAPSSGGPVSGGAVPADKTNNKNEAVGLRRRGWGVLASCALAAALSSTLMTMSG